MKYAPLICFGLVLLPIGAGVYLAFEEPDRSTTVAAASLRTELPTPAETRRPKLVVDRREHDFGTLPIAATGECRFKIRNDGSAPLHLWSPSSAFGRLEVSLSQSTLEPGESTFALVRWNTADELETFDSTSLITSNDPAEPQVQIRVHGLVQSEIACQPSLLSALEIRPHKQTVIETLVFSHTWERLDVVNLTCTHELLQCEARSASPEQLTDQKAKSGYIISVTFPSGLPHGPFNEHVSFDVVSPETEQVRKVDIPLQGRILRRLAVYGEEIEFTGVVNLGVVRSGQEKNVRLLMKVRDEQLELTVKNIVTKPDFVGVNVSDASTGSEDSKGHYYLDFTVPKTAPVSDYTNTNGHDLGKVTIQFDHPRITDLELKLYLTVERKPK
jgi:hypothetical protein